MIKIKKSDNPPRKLIKEGKDETDTNKKLYDADPDAYQSGKKKFKFKKSIYGHKTVKEQLITEQFGKCCFCEADFTSNSYGDVEHFRPKGGYQQRKNDRVKKSGYYWKAYDWDNLFFSCQVCNSRHKKNYFPLEDENQRAICHHDDIVKERPLLVHPSADDPEQHIGFREEVCFYRDEKGKKSISAFGINRDKLLEARREFLNSVKNNHFLAKLDFENSTPEVKEFILSRFNGTEKEFLELVRKARRFINQAAKASAPFAGMVRHKYPDLPT
jgi:uncharacterized protein (TIGR02646 family)